MKYCNCVVTYGVVSLLFLGRYYLVNLGYIVCPGYLAPIVIPGTILVGTILVSFSQRRAHGLYEKFNF